MIPILDSGCCSSCAAEAQPPKEVVTAGPGLEGAPVLKEASETSQPSQPDALTPVSPRSLLRMITDDSVVDVSIKSERLESLTNPKLEQGMIRAITLRKSIRQMGRLWRRPLLPMPEERLMDLYEWSHPAEEYDYFLSHTWETWGGLKYISLLMHSSHRFLLGCWLSAVVLCWCVCLMDLLPTFGHVNPEALDWWAEGEGCPTGPWIICSGFISVIVGLLLAPYLPDSCSRSDHCFMDAVCIHQADPEKKRQGIDAIAGFLSVSRQLRILWSPSYLSRLWCVFEIAAYRKVNPRGQVVLAPLFLERMVLLTLITSYGIAGLLWTLGVQSYNDTIYALSLSPMLLLIHALRRNATGKTKLFEELVARLSAEGSAERFKVLRRAVEGAWFEHGLFGAQARKALIFLHVPLFEAATKAKTVVWNSEEVLQVLHSHSDTVVAVFAGHDHNGGYAVDAAGIHHITMNSPLTAEPGSDCYAVLECHSDGWAHFLPHGRACVESNTDGAGQAYPQLILAKGSKNLPGDERSPGADSQ
ncbi:unnamed protein product, partial [Symbiodinium sp. CCMP2456]